MENSQRATMAFYYISRGFSILITYTNCTICLIMILSVTILNMYSPEEDVEYSLGVTIVLLMFIGDFMSVRNCIIY